MNRVDFGSIGSNDLIQYLFAVDRNNESVAEDYNPEHPVLWSLLDSISQAAKKSGKNVDRLLGSVNKIIERRHNIVHDGDYNIHGKINPVRETDINRISDLKICHYDSYPVKITQAVGCRTFSSSSTGCYSRSRVLARHDSYSTGNFRVPCGCGSAP